MPHCTISELQKTEYHKLEPEKLIITKGECFVGRFVALTDEILHKDGKNSQFKTLVIEDFDQKLYKIALFGFHDRLISGVRLLRRGDHCAVACTALKDGKYPTYSIAFLKPENAQKIAFKAPSVNSDSAGDDIPF